jgi:hypothetical protein
MKKGQRVKLRKLMAKQGCTAYGKSSFEADVGRLNRPLAPRPTSLDYGKKLMIEPISKSNASSPYKPLVFSIK